MNTGGKSASCTACGMVHSIERVREMLSETTSQDTLNSPFNKDAKQIDAGLTSEPIAKISLNEESDSEWETLNDFPEEDEADSEWESVYDDSLENEEDSVWEPVLDPDESYYTRYLLLNAKLYPKSKEDSWELIEWDIWSEGNCEFHIDFYDAAMSKLFPEDYLLCQKKKAKARKISDRIEAIHDLYENVWWDIQLSPEQLKKLDSLLEAFTTCEASAINPSQPVWEMEQSYPDHDLKHKVRGSISEENEVLMKLKEFLLEILVKNIRERYPWIDSVDLNP